VYARGAKTLFGCKFFRRDFRKCTIKPTLFTIVNRGLEGERREQMPPGTERSKATRDSVGKPVCARPRYQEFAPDSKSVRNGVRTSAKQHGGQESPDTATLDVRLCL
jgi:hypothetical protein